VSKQGNAVRRNLKSSVIKKRTLKVRVGEKMPQSHLQNILGGKKVMEKEAKSSRRGRSARVGKDVSCTHREKFHAVGGNTTRGVQNNWKA